MSKIHWRVNEPVGWSVGRDQRVCRPVIFHFLAFGSTVEFPNRISEFHNQRLSSITTKICFYHDQKHPSKNSLSRVSLSFFRSLGYNNQSGSNGQRNNDFLSFSLLFRPFSSFSRFEIVKSSVLFNCDNITGRNVELCFRLTQKRTWRVCVLICWPHCQHFVSIILIGGVVLIVNVSFCNIYLFLLELKLHSLCTLFITRKHNLLRVR